MPPARRRRLREFEDGVALTVAMRTRRGWSAQGAVLDALPWWTDISRADVRGLPSADAAVLGTLLDTLGDGYELLGVAISTKLAPFTIYGLDVRAAGQRTRLYLVREPGRRETVRLAHDRIPPCSLVT